VDQFSQSKLPIPERLPHSVFDDPALQINRLPSRWRKFDAGRVFHDPSDLLKILDWKQQEFGIAAALSNDHNMIDDYNSGDAYLGFA
jgi:hypothetical protein